MPQEPGKIRNVAVVGHRGTGKTSLVEAMLFQAGRINRLGTVEAGTTVSDWDDDEQRRQMSLAGSLSHLEWQGRKINLIDTPGDTGFQADTTAGGPTYSAGSARCTSSCRRAVSRFTCRSAPSTSSRASSTCCTTARTWI